MYSTGLCSTKANVKQKKKLNFITLGIFAMVTFDNKYSVGETSD